MFKKKIPIIFVGLSVVVAALVLSYTVFVKQEVVAPVEPAVVSDDNQNGEDDEIITDSPDLEDDVANDNNISEIDISDWETYQNEEFGFEVKYPEDWNVSVEEYEPRWHETVLGRIVISGSAKDYFYAPLSITIRSNEEELSIKEWFQRNYSKDDSSKLQEVKFNEIEGMRFSKRSNSIGSFYFSNEDKIYNISALDSQENIENQMRMTNQLLSTFKFIK